MVAQEILHGMVLSVMPVGEHDRRVVLLTEERGKIAAFARGARKVNSPLLAKCQPFATGAFTVYIGRDSYTIMQAEISEYFKEISVDFEAVCYGCYFCEFAGYFAKENLKAGDLLNLLYLTLSMLIKRRFSFGMLQHIFELKVLSLEGEAPWVSDCVSCHKKGDLHWFFYSRGGLLCSECILQFGKNTKESDAFLIEESVRQTLNYIIFSPLNKLYSFQLTDDASKKFSDFVRFYVKKTIPYEFKSLQILQ